ncbi:MAG: ATP-binding protein [Caldilineaceae bacterium]
MKLVDRERELEELNMLIRKPTARLVAVSGRRRLGKTTLLIHWAMNSGLPYLYWVGSHFPSATLLQQFSQQIWRLEFSERTPPLNFSYSSWSEALEMLARLCCGEQKHIIILDEFPYAVASEPGLPSALQNVWDHHLRFSNVCIVLCGSQVGMMERLLGPDAPLYGRMVGPLRVRPLPFRAVREFLPAYSAEQRVATYAILGGVPAYLEEFSDQLSLSDNLRQHLYRETGLFRTDPDFLIGEQVRDLKNYQAVLSAIADGARQSSEIAAQANLPHRTSADSYLAHLVEMDYVSRELPVTVPPNRRARSRQGRYKVIDNYLRFYFRFVRPNLALLAQRLHDQIEQRIAEQLRAFIGMTTFEELCQEWVLAQARTGKLAFPVEQVGAHWGGDVQVDVVAIHWREKQLLLGEAKWQMDTVDRTVLRDLTERKTARLLKLLPDGGAGWQVHHTLFARIGFTEGVRNEANLSHVRLVDLNQIDTDLNLIA